MRKVIILGISTIILGFAGYVAFMIVTTRSHSPKEVKSYDFQDLSISVDYCRPFKKGRKIFGGLVPFGDYWRTGANDATEISFSRDVLWQGQQVPKGRYRLYSIPNINEWTVVLNSELAQWGAFLPNPDLDVAKVIIPARQTTSETEQFTVSFRASDSTVNMYLAWEKTEIIIGIK